MTKKFGSLFLCLMLIISATIMIMPSPAANANCTGPNCRTYTLDADFDEGVLNGVEHETVHDQLQLAKKPFALPFIWVPNSNEGTISKVSTEPPYNELGRYRVTPPGLPANGSPSRTTVDQQGNCWVGNRQAGTVVKVGLLEAGNWIDRNGNGVCDTSRDLNNDGNITGGELLPWGQDECVLYEVVLIEGHQGTYVPGTYPGPYDTDYWGTSPRGLAVDQNNNVWAGTWSSHKFYHINSATGQIINADTMDVAPHSSYGVVMDKYGMLWSAQLGTEILRINPANPAEKITIPLNHTYGIGLDYQDHLFVGGNNALTKIDIITGTVLWTKGASTSQGVCCTSDNDVWVDAGGNLVYRYDNEGNYKAQFDVGSNPTGVAVDAAGKVWACNVGDEYITRINPADNTIMAQKQIIGGYHYSYSDMTGMVSGSITVKKGTWEVVYDSGVNDTPWGTICWNSSEPPGTSITVQAMSSNDGVNYSPAENATNGIPLSTTPNGRYLRAIVTFTITSGDISPILYDLTICSKAPPSGRWEIYNYKQKDTGNDWTCDENFENIVQLPTNTADTTITLEDTNGDGKNDKANITVKNGFPTYYNSIVLDVKNIGTLPIKLANVKIIVPDQIQYMMLESPSSIIKPGKRRAIGIDFRVWDGAPPQGDYTITVSL